MAAVVVIGVEITLEGLAAAGAWAYRAYRAYRVASAAEAVLTQAQEAAKADDDAKKKAQTEAQAKADEAASSNCKNCNEDPDCQTARDKLKDALYGIKGVTSETGRGLAERLCHWLHGSDEKLRASHLDAVSQAADRVSNARKWLQGKGDRPVSKSERSTLNKKQKNSKPQNCNQPADLIKDAEELEKMAKEVADGKSSIQPLPRADFAAACAQDAFGLVKKVLGK